MMSMWQFFDGDWLGNSGWRTLRQQLRDEVIWGGLKSPCILYFWGCCWLGDTIEYIYSIVHF